MTRIPGVAAVLATVLSVVLGLTALCGVAAAQGPDPCTAFAWNVTHELALFAHPASAATAGKDAGSAPLLAPDKGYDLMLAPQGEVSFAKPPSKRALNDGAYAGLARVHIASPGIYRVAIDGPFWIDVLADGSVLQSGDFTGSHSCTTLTKLVEFTLPAGDVLVQLSGAPKARVHVAVTPKPRS
jgi:hypothetical protein